MRNLFSLLMPFAMALWGLRANAQSPMFLAEMFARADSVNTRIIAGDSALWNCPNRFYMLVVLDEKQIVFQIRFVCEFRSLCIATYCRFVHKEFNETQIMLTRDECSFL